MREISRHGLHPLEAMTKRRGPNPRTELARTKRANAGTRMLRTLPRRGRDEAASPLFQRARQRQALVDPLREVLQRARPALRRQLSRPRVGCKTGLAVGSLQNSYPSKLSRVDTQQQCAHSI